VKCVDKIYHPNIDLKGNVCLNLLKNDWTAILSTQQVVHGLLFLFVEPNPADPLNIEAAKVMRDNPSQFKRNVDKALRGGTVDSEYYESRLNK
jgi:ubiquitin-conjugating enzyme E2 M